MNFENIIVREKIRSIKSSFQCFFYEEQKVMFFLPLKHGLELWLQKLKMCTINSVHARYKTKWSLYTLNNYVFFSTTIPVVWIVTPCRDIALVLVKVTIYFFIEWIKTVKWAVSSKNAGKQTWGKMKLLN